MARHSRTTRARYRSIPMSPRPIATSPSTGCALAICGEDGSRASGAGNALLSILEIAGLTSRSGLERSLLPEKLCCFTTSKASAMPCNSAVCAAIQGSRPEIILEIESPLQELFSRLPGISRCLAKGAQLPTFDFHCPLTSPPLAFSTTLDTIPSEVPYLPQASEGAGPQQLGPSERPRIGLVWSGNPNHTNDRNRSLPFRELLPLLDGVAAEFVSLQKNLRPEDEELLQHEATSSILVRRCAISPIPLRSPSSSTSSFQSIRASSISPAASDVRCGSCCPIFPIGGGCSIATIRPGTPPHDCSARPQHAIGRR